jgi:hypothetical protein
MVAITQRGLRTAVTAGENSGATIAHGPVVRSLKWVADLGASGLDAQITQPKRASTRVVVFVEGRDSLHVLGAAAIE